MTAIGSRDPDTVTRPATRSGSFWAGLTATGVLLLLLTVMVLAAMTRSRVGAHSVGHGCRQRLKQYATGLYTYCLSHDRALPLAWNVSGPSVAEDMSNLNCYRLAIQSHYEGGFSPIVTAADLRAAGGNALRARKEKFEANSLFWSDPPGGWTKDYFAPDILFRWPERAGGSHGKAVDLSVLYADVPGGERPLFADVSASLPNPEAKDPDDPEHEAEMRKGFSFVRDAGIEVFVGAGPSLRRRPGDLSSSRFDFRHNRAANVIFLDGHVELIRKDDAARLQEIHRNWNSLKGAEGGD